MKRPRISRRIEGEASRERWEARLAAISGPSRPFRLAAPFQPSGDQPQAIERLVAGYRAGERHQVLLGVTGSGKTFTIASAIERLRRPTLVLAPNKTLAAQLYAEFREFFPDNAVEYFVSYYDYYQPEAYVPTTDTYIEKDASINEQIEQLRLAATKALLERRDALIVATVSAIYGLGSPDEYYHMAIHLVRGERLDQREFLRRLSQLQYARGDFELRRGSFRVRGETVDVFPAEHESLAVRVALFDGEIERLTLFDPLSGAVIEEVPKFTVYPRSHYVTTRRTVLAAVESIKQELAERLSELEAGGRILEAERLRQRTRFDLEMLLEIGHCQGIENYSRHLTGRAPGEPPPTLFDYLPADALLVVDESHVTVPQLAGMYRGDRARKETLVEYGFRLPSALDNRPLRFEEWERRAPPTIFVSATPGPYELERARGEVVELVVRPTGLVDPEIEVRPASRQVDDLLAEVRERVAMGDRVLVTTLTKRMAEHLTEFLAEHGVRVRYLHSDVETVERVEILRDLRLGAFDVLVGINLLREGLDLPEVSLVAILDADKEGFLRSAGSLIQTIGRCARNVRGKAILYADSVTDSMRAAIEETERRRRKQLEYNERYGIVPRSVSKPVTEILDVEREPEPARARGARRKVAEEEADYRALSPDRLAALIAELERRMYDHARNLEFEEAAALRDRIRAIRAQALFA